jgi:hypothetical protein
VAVLRSPLQGAQDQQVESALQDFQPLRFHVVEILLPKGVGCLLPMQP